MTTIRYRKPDILEEVSADSHAVIEASAGTGKTYTLKHLVVELLLQGVALDEILIVTFTRRATSDLQRQVRTVLAEVLRIDHDGCDENEPHWLIDDDIRPHVRQAMLDFDRAQIYTIHSFCQKLLTEHAFFNGRSFDLKHVDEETLFEDCFEEVLRGPLSTEPKLRRWLDIWLLPSVNGKADDLGDTLFEIFKSPGKLGQTEREFSIDELVEEAEKKAKKGKTLGDKDKHTMRTECVRQLEPVVAKAVARRKEEEGLYCYSDMLSMVADTLKDETASTSLREIVRRQYRYALIDEFQDTDREQWEIFRDLFVEDTDDHRLYVIGDPKQSIYRFRGADVWSYVRARRRLTTESESPHTLGYNYRSTPQMVEAYNAIFDQKAGEPFFTNDEINYKKPVKPNPVATRSVRRAQDETTPAAITAMRINEDGAKKADLVPRWLDWMATEMESLLWGQEQLKVQSDSDTSWEKIDAGDIFVLTNSHREAGEVADLLRERGIPYAFYRQEGLFQSHQALDVLALLKGIAQPGRRRYRRAAFRTPFFAVPISDLVNFDESSTKGKQARQTLTDWRQKAEERKFDELFEDILSESGITRRQVTLDAGERALTNYQQLFEIIAERAAQSSTDLNDLIRWLERKIDGDTEDGDDEDSDNIQRLESDRPAVQLMTMHKSKGLEAEVVFVYGGFGGRGSKLMTDSDDPTNPDAARLRFLSSSKKFLSDEQKERLKQQDRWDSERLMYVAMTRAKSRLYLCNAGPDTKYGKGKRYEAVARRLNALYRSGDFPESLEFIDVGPVDSHPDAREPVEVPAEEWVEAVGDLPNLKQAADADIGPLERSFETARTSRRRSVSFSGLRTYKSTEPIELRTDDEEDEADILADEDFDWGAHLRGERFDEDTPILGGGTKPGSFLHEILEHIPDYGSVLDFESADRWAEASEVESVLTRFQDRYGIGDEYRPYTARLLFDTLRTPMELPDGSTLAGVARAEDDAREISFRFPMPQSGAHFTDWPDGGPTVEKGWVNGEIDLVFRHNGQTYIADWKSNAREDYSPRALAEYVDNHYALQARLYILAAVRLLGITDAETYDARFGGCGYLFVRAMSPNRPGQGVIWRKPGWEELLEWDEFLRSESHYDWKVPSPTFTPDFA